MFLFCFIQHISGFPGGASGKEPTCQCRKFKRCRFHPWVGKIPWRRAWQPTPVLLPREAHGQRSLAGSSPWGHKELNTTVEVLVEELYVSLPLVLTFERVLHISSLSEGHLNCLLLLICTKKPQKKILCMSYASMSCVFLWHLASNRNAECLAIYTPIFH